MNDRLIEDKIAMEKDERSPDLKIYSSCGQQAYNALRRACGLHNILQTPKKTTESMKSIPVNGRRKSLTEESSDTSTLVAESEIVINTPPTDTVLYLAYGSNLSAETFRGSRGIKPLRQVNVLVPELELCFDLAGIPYGEPCFANSRLRSVKPPWSTDSRKPQWQKGLVGVVYTVTKADYAKIIATEGGGSTYKDIVVPCFELPRGTNIIQPIPRTLPFPAHTLFSPNLPTKPGEPPKAVGRIARPNPDYAQASARYLKLITDGAAEHNLPLEYQNYLLKLSPYTITSRRQKIGQAILFTIWLPLILAVLGLGQLFADENGRIPASLGVLSNLVMTGVWTSYDRIFKPVFGDGERTQEEEGSEGYVMPDSLDAKFSGPVGEPLLPLYSD